MTAFGSAETNGYTGDGLRAWKQGSAGRTYFLYDGDAPVCELDGSGAVTATDTFGADGLLSRHTASGSVFYAFDLSGNAVQRAASDGSPLSSDVYDAFGGRQTTASTPDVFGFSGQWGGYTDTETGLVLLTHRFYDPATGRFLTRDPMGYRGGINLYAYTGNDPVNRADPSGLRTYGFGVGGLGFCVPFSKGGIVGGGFDGTVSIDTDGTVAVSCDGYIIQGAGSGAGGSPECTYSPGNLGYNPGTGILGTVGGFHGGVGALPIGGGGLTFPEGGGPPTFTVSGGPPFGRPVAGGGAVEGGSVTAGFNLPEFCRSVAQECNSVADHNSDPSSPPGEVGVW